MAEPNPFPEGGVRPLHTNIGRPKPAGSYFDAEAADKAVRFFPQYLRHTQGPLAGQPFELVPEQVWVTREAFGWMRADGKRLYRTVYIEMGRANGKSQWGAGVAGKLLYADGEPNAEVAGAGADREQAAIILNRLKAMVDKSPELSKRSRPLRKEIRVKNSLGDHLYRAMSADVPGAWGGSQHGVIFDEVHAQRHRDLWDALVTGTGKREQPMVWAFTTAGWDRESLCWELHEYAREIAEGIVSDTSFLGVIWAAPEDADWTDPEVWRQANPLMGVAFEEDFLARECERAKAIPAFQNTFRTMYLSQWVGQEVRFVPLEAWDRCNEQITVGKRPAFGGMDLSSTTDLSGFVVVSDHDGKVDVDVRLYVPADGLHERSRRDRVPYEVWVRDGLLTPTPGPTIDQDYIKADVIAAAQTYDLIDVSYDRWNAAKIVAELEGEGLTMVQMGQGFASMSAPTKELLRLVLEGKIRHGAHPILRWMIDNTAPKTDPAGNVKPDKERSAGRIDGVVALIMALDGLSRRGRNVKRRSVYEDRGLVLAG